MPMISQDRIAAIRSFEDLAAFCHEVLGWPLATWRTFEGVPELYGIQPEEVPGVQRLAAVQPLDRSQSWGIFEVDFGNTTMRRSALRRVLNKVAERARQHHANPTWLQNRILFIVRDAPQPGKQRWTFAYYRGQRLADARLRAFGWSDPEFTRTVREQNLPRLAWERQGDQWEDAWNVDALTDAFFAEYERVFREVEAMVQGLEDAEDKRRFTQMLFNRLMFLCFLQQKGWLEYPAGASGNRTRYLFELYDAFKPANDRAATERCFYDRLRLLFFSGLNSPNGTGGRHELIKLIGRVPFLNGGLFEPDPRLDTGDISVDDEAFKLILAKPDGLFRRYNFTITESTPEDVEVALDPEVLGKIFEELVTGRHDSGSYYTPRPIVAFMCREALKGYLGGYERLVDEHDAGGINVHEARDLIHKLESIKVCDPACGSGAYLVGMLQEIVALLNILDTTAHELTPRDDFQRKLRVIEHCLYGVDNDPFAVSIAWLRLWLALALEDSRNPLDQPDEDVSLPNLDLKIEVGDSLLAPSPDQALPSTQLSILAQIIHEYRVEKAEYMTARSKEQKQLLRERIERTRAVLVEQLNSSAPPGSVNWAVEFVEVFLEETGERAGFDVILANPPYVRQELLTEIKPALRRAYGDLFTGTADLYCYFYIRAMQLLKPGGMLAFISSNKWFRAKYGEKLRRFLAENAEILSITDFRDLPVFARAAAYAMIFIARKHPPTEGLAVANDSAGSRPVLTLVESLEPPYPEVKALISKSGFSLPEEAIQGPTWRLADEQTLRRLQTMEENGIPLGEYVKGKIYYGIKTGFNEAFVIDGAKRAELIAEDPKSEEIIKPLAVGDDVRRWHIRRRDRWLIVTKVGVDMSRYPAVMRHLSRWEPQLRRRRDQGNHWWELRACAYYAEFEKPKIVFPDIAVSPRFALDSSGLYLPNTLYLIPFEDRFLLGILNSNVLLEWYLQQSAQIRGGYIRYIRQYVAAMPIPRASDADRIAIAALVQRCLDAKAADPDADVSKYEAEINARVEFLYFHRDDARPCDN